MKYLAISTIQLLVSKFCGTLFEKIAFIFVIKLHYLTYYPKIHGFQKMVLYLPLFSEV